MAASPHSITARSIGLGLIGTCVLSGLAYFNDYVVNNTPLLGSHLPATIVLMLVGVALVNAALWRWRPGAALSQRELAVALAMMLVGCTLAPAGLMRYLPGHLIGVVARGGSDFETRQFLQELDLPDWIFPAFDSDDLQQRSSEPVVTHFTSRAPAGDAASTPLGAVPWSKWIRPAASWGLLLAALYGAILALAVIVQEQWSRNERLAFPLATVYVSLIEPPERGRRLNGLMSSRAFWLSATAVFAVHTTGALHQYIPAWPAVPLTFDLSALLADPPWTYAEPPLKRSSIFFTIVGITFFVHSSTAFSLWFFYLLMNIAKMLYGTHGGTLSGQMSSDQMFGALVPFALAIIWTGRRHWATVAGQMFHRTAENDDGPRSGRVAGWGLTLCFCGVVAWLIAAGASLAGAIVLTLMLLTILLVLARIVAETGLIVVEMPVLLNVPWTFALQELPPAMATRTTLRTHFYSALFQSLFAVDPKQSLSVYATNAVEIWKRSDASASIRPGAAANTKPGVAAFVGVLALALAASYIMSGASALICEYSYSATLDRLQLSPINEWGTRDSVESETIGRSMVFQEPQNGPRAPHNRLVYFSFGAGLTTALLLMRWNFAGWPLHPIGYLMAYSSPIQEIWFSVLVGWLAKVLAARLGGSGMILRARPVFIGLIVGEAAAATFWLIVSLARLSASLEYHAVKLLPG